MANQAYEELITLVKKAGLMESVGELLGWDQEIMMPPGAAWLRALESGIVASVGHELFTDPRIGELLQQLKTDTSLTDEQQANIREISEDYKRAQKVPSELVKEFAEVTAQSQEVWKKARENNDFASFAPWLEKIITLTKKKAAYIDPSKHPYEVMLNDYEKDITLEDARHQLETVKQAIVPLLQQISKCEQPNSEFLKQQPPEDKQLAFNTELAKAIGYDFNKGRLDVSVHPFTAAYGRISIRFSNGWIEGIMSTIHESGHGMYEHQLPDKHVGTPLGASRSLSVHESQSRIWENNVGRSEGFWRFFYPKIKETYTPMIDDVPFDQFLQAVNKLEPGFIRVEADELTYTLHIILRFEIEQALIGGELGVKDIPAVWNQKMQDLLGITPPTDTLGCLQDIHWSFGLFGYFATYSLGSMISAQLMVAIKRDIPDLEQQFEKGKFTAFNAWLRENIHQHGCRYTTRELIKKATGKNPAPQDYIDYLTDKAKQLYGL